MCTCICCQDLLLRHIRKGGVYWYCPHCRHEMPNFESLIVNRAFSEKASLPQKAKENVIVFWPKRPEHPLAG